MSTVKTGVTIPADLLQEIEDFMQKAGIRSRSKLISEALRLYLSERKYLLDESRTFVGGIFIVYNHERGETLEKLVDAQHDYLEIIKSVLHLHITHEKCVEILAVEGSSERIKGLVSALENILGVELVKVFAIEKK